jgi:hypothetical protein
MSSLPGGPAFTQLRIGDTGLPGVIVSVFQGGAGGLLAFRGGNFPSNDFVPLPGPLDCGQFQFAGSFFDVGDSVLFDIDEGAFGPWAVNVIKI